MIVTMKKVALVAQSKDKALALGLLADASVFHVTAKDGYSENLHNYSNELNTLTALFNSLPAKVKADDSFIGNYEVLVDKINRLREKIKANADEIVKLKTEFERAKKWGNFNPDELKQLTAGSFAMRFYVVDKITLKQLNKLKDETVYFILAKAKNLQLLLTLGEVSELFKGKEFVVPQKSLALMQNEIRYLALENRKFNDELVKLAAAKHLIKERINQLTEQIEYEKTSLAVDEQGELVVIRGFVPEPDYAAFKEQAKTNKWAAIYDDVAFNEDVSGVPTKSVYRGVGKMSSIILRAFDLIPGYREFDMTTPLFIFFSLFYALLVNDAGYGLVFLSLGLVACGITIIKGKKIGAGHIFWLWLSIPTVIWGALKGSWFAVEAIAERPFLDQFNLAWFVNDQNIMWLSFTIALVHLTYAHLMAFFRKVRTNFWQSFADLGSIGVLLGIYQVVLMLILDVEPSSWTPHVIAIGFALIVLFGQQSKGVTIGKGMLSGLAGIFPTLLGSIGNFSDIISYIRLYAVGLAGAGIAMAFNDLAFGTTADLGLTGVPAVLFLAVFLTIAHVMNMVLAIMAVIVHAVRLNSLEFSSHLGQQWSGFHYKPFVAKNILEENN
ncbi:MAG: hypothetical protein FWE37_06720 [Spirochaetaceae bacterium]|nr:hypothetical protein [Spirochaetaceae bacterium]